MSILKISRLGHPILLKKAKPVNDILAKEVQKIVFDMTETMLDAKGIGLAAPQVHINKQIIIFRTLKEDEGGKEEEKEKEVNITALINPKIIKISDETDDAWEGCLSIPGMLGLVKRFSEIKYEGYDIQGNLIQKKVNGLNARVVQHEFDHLLGILYVSRLADPKAFGFADEIEEFWKKIYESRE
jgi:peptide deformylase